MAYEIKEKRGSLWKNETATSENKQPTKSGSFKLDGKVWNIAVWEDQKSKDGSKTYDSISVSEYKPKSDSVNATTPPVFEGEVPF
jgi:hypothetical protein